MGTLKCGSKDVHLELKYLHVNEHGEIKQMIDCDLEAISH